MTLDQDALLGSDRAEDLTSKQVLSLFAGAGGDEAIVARLMSSGMHLLQGSRGTGKTMLLRVAYERLKAERPTTLPVFVSFSRYLATYNANAEQRSGYSPFQHWVFAKLLSGIRDSVNEIRPEVKLKSNIFGPIPLDQYISQLESHHDRPEVANPAKGAALLGVTESDLVNFARLDGIQQRIVAALDACEFESVAFFLDEAAQNFAEELQPEFFQLMRHLRHYRISTKAAVYPNTTNYGRDFDVGQDAITLSIDRPIENSEGMALFQELVRRRFSDSKVGAILARSDAQTKFLIKASGGNPRWFIHLLNWVNLESGDVISNAQAMAAAKQLPDQNLWPYLKRLQARLRSKQKYVDAAVDLAQVLIDGIREANKGYKRDSNERPTCYVAISTHKTVPYRVHAAMKLLQYAGIIFSRGPKKITGRDRAEMFLVHPAILVRENALFGGEVNLPVDAWVSALTDPARERFKEYTRNSPRLLDFSPDEDSDLVACESCGAAVPQESRFCMQCGKPISHASPYEELLSQPIEALELTPGIKQRVLAHGKFKTVGSIRAATNEELDDIPAIGEKRIPLIRYAVEEFLAG
ncbi:zinc ribbon domain-containing protein [Corallococcus sp. AB018]|uniref:zinc ribbon domain-containing protein n=1 Tax=Corallococcus sp. AB018 TaxID=2316715 RepID=UPI000F892D91|nr:zinc ribbon domain-containing protein [Corallococcus sp. AB018]